MAYTRVQFIAYEADTTAGESSWTGRPKYLGSSDVDKDIAKRCGIMKDAIHNAFRLQNLDTSSNTLKIFMAPEFYFRNTAGAYPIEKVSKVMETMREKTNDDKYAHWLFVFGTAIGMLDSGDDTEVFNVAMVQRGGPRPRDGGLREVVSYKEYVSHIDFFRRSDGSWSDPANRKAKIGGRTRAVANRGVEGRAGQGAGRQHLRAEHRAGWWRHLHHG